MQPPAGTCSSKGGPIDGADNNHCVVGGVQQIQATGKCEGVGAAAPSGGDAGASGGSSGGGDASGGGDGSASTVDAGDTGECDEPGYGVTNYGTSAADDDCKYDVSYTVTPVCQNANVYFTVTVTKRADKSPLTGASVSAEVYNDDCATIAPNSGQTTVEQGGGTYKVGPIQFKNPPMSQGASKWIVRFHFDQCCSDMFADSPHGHAAFWVSVP
jgi:hypothetical protein